MSDDQTTDAGQFQYHGPLIRLVADLSTRMRRRMFDVLMTELQPDAGTTVVDVGVTCDSRPDSNFFEKLYPYANRITAVGLEDAHFLERQYPGLKYVKADALRLPFPDDAFDLALSFAVVEHVGSRERQRDFVAELLRVGKRCLITTPNRWYPVEFHTVLPLLHWLPPTHYRKILRCLGQEFFASEEHLNLLGAQDLLSLIPSDKKGRLINFRLLGMVSNLMLVLD